MDLLECPLCLFLMTEPVSMSCGHTFCRSCVSSYLPSRCPSCKERFKQREVRSTRNNVLLISVAEKCCPDQSKTKCQIVEKLKADEFTEALRIANQGLESGKGGQSQLQTQHSHTCAALAGTDRTAASCAAYASEGGSQF